MNITKYNTIFLIGILLSGILAVHISSLVINIEAAEDHEYKKNINIQKKSCKNINVNINGETIKEISEGDPICKNININRQISNNN
ncbi:MAG: hypothetical protein ACE5SW_13350 [Nitrososphaeraceae archaeon]